MPASRPSPSTVANDPSASNQLDALIRRLPSPRAALVETLDGSVHASIDADAEVPSASTIKLPLMIATLQAISDGRIKADERHVVREADVVGGSGILQSQVGRSLSITELLETTLTYSDNTGANMLLDAIGGLDEVDRVMSALGYKHTHMLRRLMDVQAQRQGLENTTSANDLAAMLSSIDTGNLVSREASAEMLRILKLRGQQTDPSLDFLGRHLTPRPTIAHLNGTLAGVRNDAGAIDLPSGPVLMVILLHNQADESAAEESIARTAADAVSVLSSRRAGQKPDRNQN